MREEEREDKEKRREREREREKRAKGGAESWEGEKEGIGPNLLK